MSGFFDWLKGSSKTKREITLDDAPSEISDLEKETFSELYEYTREMRSHVNSNLEDIRDVCRDLKGKEVDEETHPRLKSSISMKKKNLVSKGLSMPNIEKVEIKDWEGLLKFRKKVFEVLTRFNKASKEAYEGAGSCVGGSCGAPPASSTMAIVSKGFKKEVSTLNKILKKVSSELQSLDEKINSYKDDRESFSHIKDKLEELNNLEESIGKLSKEIEDKGEELSNLKDRKSELEKEIGEIENSEEFEEVKEAEKGLEKLEEKREKLGVKLKSKMNIIKKGMKKYLHNHRTLLDDDRVELIESYLNDPIEALSSDSSLEILEIMEDVEGEIQNDNIDFSSDRKEKILNDLQKLPKDIERARNKLDKLSEKRKEMEDRLDSDKVEERKEASREKEKVEKKLGKLKSEISELQERKEKEEERLESLKTEISQNLEKNFNLKLESNSD